MIQRSRFSAAFTLLLTPALLCLPSFFCSPCQADIVLTAVGVSVVESFDAFRGDGFAATPTATQLDSDTYRMTGLSDGSGVFGGSHTAGDFARGSSTGGVTTGGIYGFDVGGGDFGVGVQPTATDANPGSFTIRLLNMTGQSLDTVDFSAAGYFFNDQNRSSRWTIELSLDDAVYTPIFSLDSVELADPVPSWQFSPIVTSVTSPTAVANGGQFYIRFTGTDLAGTGSRDEFALAGFSVSVRNAIPEPGSVGLICLASIGILSRRRRN